jgi:hypothetical protein
MSGIRFIASAVVCLAASISVAVGNRFAPTAGKEVPCANAEEDASNRAKGRMRARDGIVRKFIVN